MAELMPPVAKMCFMAIKAIRKDKFAKFPQKISSYCLKSILLCTLEKSDPNLWLSQTEDNISRCFHFLLDEVIQAFEEQLCPHFWIPGIDLFKDYSDETLRKATNVLKKVQRRPNFYIEPFPKAYLDRFPKVRQSNDDNDYELVRVI